MQKYVLMMTRAVIIFKNTCLILDLQNSEGLQNEDFLSILETLEITKICQIRGRNKSNTIPLTPINFCPLIFISFKTIDLLHNQVLTSHLNNHDNSYRKYIFIFSLKLKLIFVTLII